MVSRYRIRQSPGGRNGREDMSGGLGGPRTITGWRNGYRAQADPQAAKPVSLRWYRGMPGQQVQ